LSRICTGPRAASQADGKKGLGRNHALLFCTHARRSTLPFGVLGAWSQRDSGGERYKLLQYVGPLRNTRIAKFSRPKEGGAFRTECFLLILDAKRGSCGTRHFELLGHDRPGRRRSCQGMQNTSKLSDSALGLVSAMKSCSLRNNRITRRHSSPSRGLSGPVQRLPRPGATSRRKRARKPNGTSRS